MHALPNGLTRAALIIPICLVALAAPALASDAQAARGAQHAQDAQEAQAAQDASAASSASSRVIVSFHHMPDLHAHDQYLGASVLSVDPALGFAVVDASNVHGFSDQARAQHDVRAVQADSVASVSMVPNDPEYAMSQYGPQFIGAPAAWNTTMGSASVPACIVDSGVRRSHVDLAGAYAGGIDLVNGDSDPTDDNGHGTHVAGIAAARTDNGIGMAGIAQVPLLVAKVLDASGNGYSSTVASGIRWCADNGARVISMSLGSTVPATALEDAVNYAYGKGAVLVAAAGNGACTNCVQYPAAYDNVVAVGCVDQNGNVCSFTSQGPQVDLAAPGNAIQSTWFTSDTAMMRAAGTSMSAPHVAGAAALVMSAHPQWTNAQVIEALKATAQDVGTAGPDAASGSGMVRADLAMAYSPSAPAPPPAPAPSPVRVLAMTPASQAKTVAAKGTATYTFQVQNNGSANETVLFSWGVSRNGFTVSADKSSIVLAPGQIGSVTLTVKAPQKSAPMTTTLTATLQSDATVTASGTAQTTVGK